MPSFEEESKAATIIVDSPPVQAVGPEKVPILKTLPAFSAVKNAVRSLNEVNCEDICSVIFDHHGAFSPSAVRMMLI
ncbi:hypothetical protein BGZ72_007704, partial [Mortierella alpina]